MSENSQEARLFFFWRRHFFPSPNPYKWHSNWLKIILGNLNFICIHVRRVSHAKNVCDVMFCKINFNTLCDAYTGHRQYIELPKRLVYIRIYSIQLLKVIFKIMLKLLSVILKSVHAIGWSSVQPFFCPSACAGSSSCKKIL